MNPEANHPAASSGPDQDLNDFMQDPLAWLAQQNETGQYHWLLAHADDGVNWGRWEDGRWTLSHDHFSKVTPALNGELLRQVRLFGPEAELFVWRDGEHWCKRVLNENAAPETHDETLLLWGAELESEKEEFVLLREGAEGLRHAPPRVKDHFDPQQERMCLRVRHHLQYDEVGQVYVAASRLVELGVQPRVRQQPSKGGK